MYPAGMGNSVSVNSFASGKPKSSVPILQTVEQVRGNESVDHQLSHQSHQVSFNQVSFQSKSRGKPPKGRGISTVSRPAVMGVIREQQNTLDRLTANKFRVEGWEAVEQEPSIY